MKNRKTALEVKKFLLKTGFPFEMAVAKMLRENGYEVKMNQFFLDLEEDKMREIDIIATKKVDNINIVFIIECKQSNRDAWVFVASENNPDRYWKYVKKYRPEIVDYEDMKKCFSGLHFFDRKKSLANNYITFNGEKQSESAAINDAVKKSIKGTISTMTEYEYDHDAEDKTLFFSAVFFSGDIFLATYNKTLIVKKENHLLLKNNFISSTYTDISGNGLSHYPTHLYSTLQEDISWEEGRKRDRIKTAKRIYTSLKPEFIIDVVKDKYIKRYLGLIENEVSNISVKFWRSEEKKEKNV